VNLSFKLVRIKVGRKAKIYSIRFDGEDKDEFQKFLENQEVRNHPDFQALRKKLKEIYDKRGLLEHYFRPEDDRCLNPEICRIDYGTGKLRLYCIRWDDNLLILSGGGVKPDDVRFWQEDSFLADCAKKNIKVFDDLKQYLKETGLKIEDLL
jgi:hypothetical protein